LRIEVQYATHGLLLYGIRSNMGEAKPTFSPIEARPYISCNGGPVVDHNVYRIVLLVPFHRSIILVLINSQSSTSRPLKDSYHTSRALYLMAAFFSLVPIQAYVLSSMQQVGDPNNQRYPYMANACVDFC